MWLIIGTESQAYGGTAVKYSHPPFFLPRNRKATIRIAPQKACLHRKQCN